MQPDDIRPPDGQARVVTGIDIDTIADLVGFEDYGTVEYHELLEEAWGGVIIAGDLTIDGDTSSKALPLGLEGFGEGFPVSKEGYLPVYFIVVLGNLTIKGNLEVEQYRDLYVAGDVDVHSYQSTSGNFICTGTLRVRDIICTNASEEGGIFCPSVATAPAWISTGDPNYYMLEDLPFEHETIDAQEFSSNRERVRRALSSALENNSVVDNEIWSALANVIGAGKVARFLEAYRDNKPKPAPLKAKSAIDPAKDRKKVEKALKKMKYGVVNISGVGSLALVKGLDFNGVVSLTFKQCEFAELENLPRSKHLSFYDCPILSAIPERHAPKLKSLAIMNCPSLKSVPREMPKLESLSLSGTPFADFHGIPNLTKLTLSGLDITELPPSICDCSLLEVLEVTNCPNLKNLPEDIGRLTNLKSLEVYDTGLEALPESIGLLSNLNRLILGTSGANRLQELPDSICNLEKLTFLWLGNNLLKALPENLGSLQRINGLDLCENQLTALPDSFWQLHPLFLKEFQYKNNPIPADLLKEYKKRTRVAYKLAVDALNTKEK